MTQMFTIFGLAWGLGSIVSVFVAGAGCAIAGAHWKSARRPQEVEACADRRSPVCPAAFFVPWIVATVVVAILHGVVGLDLIISLAIGAMVGFLGGLLDGMWLARQESLIEQQLRPPST